MDRERAGIRPSRSSGSAGVTRQPRRRPARGIAPCARWKGGKSRPRSRQRSTGAPKRGSRVPTLAPHSTARAAAAGPGQRDCTEVGNVWGKFCRRSSTRDGKGASPRGRGVRPALGRNSPRTARSCMKSVPPGNDDVRSRPAELGPVGSESRDSDPRCWRHRFSSELLARDLVLLAFGFGLGLGALGGRVWVVSADSHSTPDETEVELCSRFFLVCAQRHCAAELNRRGGHPAIADSARPLPSSSGPPAFEETRYCRSGIRLASCR